MKYKLVIFDMDGTLTEEIQDYAAIRRDMGIPLEGGIIEHIAAMPAADQARAHEILHRHEMAAADSCGVHDGATELLDSLRNQGVLTALLTRNSAASAARILGRHALRLDQVNTRENPPHKPHPDSILNITRRFGVDPRQTLMVGDYLYDLQAAEVAGTDSVLLCTPGEPRPEFARKATYCVESLKEVLALVVN